MTAPGLATGLVLGFLGSGHCVAMCGGIACALRLALDPRRRDDPRWRALCLAGYQAGRLLSYAAAGALAAVAGAGLASLVPGKAALQIGALLQASVLVLLGLYLSGAWRLPLSALEAAGARLWSALAPLRRRLLPVRGPGGALRLGLLWGGLPCGLVYSALAFAFTTASALDGALFMLAFGAGTMPAVLLTLGAAGWLARTGASRWPRRAAGVLMLVGGLTLAVDALDDGSGGHGAPGPGAPPAHKSAAGAGH